MSEADFLRWEANEIVWLNGRGLTALPRSIGRLLKLKTLSIYGNKLTELPEEIGECFALEGLNAYNNALTALPRSIGQLLKLKTLNIYGNKLTVLPEEIGECVALEKLYAYDNALTALPRSIGRLLKLKTLHIYGNKLTALPEEIGDCVALEELYAYDDALTALPRSIVRLLKLKTLSIPGNKLTALPEEIGECVALEGLYAYGNALTALPRSIGQLLKLKTLSIYGNKLTALPEEIGECVALEELNVSDNALTALPRSIDRLLKLKMLNIHSNKLTELPEEIGECVALQRFNAYGNALTALPRSIGRLLKLKTLSIYGNKLTALPEEIGECVALEVLYAYGNALTALPRSIGRLLKLKLTTLDVSSNPTFVFPPDAVARKGTGDIRRYFTELERGAIKERILKLVLIGDGEAGKTSLLRGLQAACEPTPTEASERTILLDLSKLKLGEGGSAVVCSVWDFGGQRLYSITQQPYIVPGALYLLVVAADAVEGDEDHGDGAIERHLDALQVRAPGALVQPVLTRADMLVASKAKADWLQQREQRLTRELQDLDAQVNQKREEIRACWWFSRDRLNKTLVRLEEKVSEKRTQIREGNPPELASMLEPMFAPAALADAAAPQLGRVRARIAAWFNARRRASASDAPAPLQVRSDVIPCVCSAEYGRPSLEVARSRLESLVLRKPLLLPHIDELIPRSWQAAMAMVRALRDGREVALAAARAVRVVDRAAAAANTSAVGTSQDVEPEPPADPARRLAYVSSADLRGHWASACEVAALTDAEAVLDDVVGLMCNQGEVFESPGLLFLDPAFATEVLKPFVDHQLPAEKRDRALDFCNTDPSHNVQTLLKHIDDLVQRGRVHEAMLPYMWHTLPQVRREDYDSLIQMLVNGGVLFKETAPGGANAAAASSERSWVMPMRLPEERPEGLDARLTDGRPAELCMRYELYEGLMPPGLAERCVARCNDIGTPVEAWRMGVRLALQEGDVQALLEVQRGNRVSSQSAWVVIRVRSAERNDALWHALWAAMRSVQAILDSLPGMRVGKHLVCPECLERGEKLPQTWNPDELLAQGNYKPFCHRSERNVQLQLTARLPAVLPRPPQVRDELFHSGRFKPPHEHELRELHRAEGSLGIKANIVDVGGGGNFDLETIRGLDKMAAMIVWGTEDYGEKTTTKYCSFYELKYANENGIPIIPIKLCQQWPPTPPPDHDGLTDGAALNRFILGQQGLVYLDWSQKPWDAEACAREVLEALRKLKQDGKVPGLDLP